MNELDFGGTTDSKNPTFKGPPNPLTPAMMKIAANPSQGWRDQYTLDRIARQNEKEEERKVNWARKRCNRIMAAAKAREAKEAKA